MRYINKYYSNKCLNNYGITLSTMKLDANLFLSMPKTNLKSLDTNGEISLVVDQNFEINNLQFFVIWMFEGSFKVCSCTKH